MRKNTKVRWLAWLLCFAITMSFVACQNQPNSKGSQSDVANQTTSNKGTSVKHSQDDEIVLAGARDAGRGTKDPYYTNVNLYVWEPLVGEDDKGEVEPRLATSWDMQDEGKTWVFHLRKGVVFSDGTDFNADAVLLNFDRYKKLGTASSTFFTFDINTFYPGLKAVEKVDDYTVRLRFDNPIPTLPYTIINFGSGMFSPKCFDVQTGEFNGFCIGTGPFVITDHVQDEYISLGRNDKYYGASAKAAHIKIRMIPDQETRVSALRSGEIMGVYDNNAILPQAAKELEKTGDFTASAEISANIHYLNVNNRTFPLNDVRMRQAMNLIIDRDVLINQIYHGYGTPTVNVLSPLSVFYKEIKPKHDEQEAKRLAREVLQGKPVTLRLFTTSTYKTDAELIAAWLQELGIKVDIKVMESAAVTEALKAKDFDLSIGFKGMNNAEPETMLRGFMHTDGFMNNGYAMSGYSNKKVDALLDQLKSTYVKEDRIKLYNQLQDISAEELPVIPLIGATTLVVHSNEITGYNAKFTGVTLPEVAWVN